MPFKKYLILFTLVLAELLLITYCRSIFGNIISPLLLFLISLSIGIVSIIFIKESRSFEENTPVQSFDKQTALYLLLFLGLSSLFFFIPKSGLLGIYKVFPINPSVSDVIPAIQVLCKRFVNGEEVYQSINNFGYQMSPSYLPMIWLPYVPAEIFHFDYRYTMIFIWILTGILLISLAIRKDKGFKNGLCVLLLAFYLLSIVDREPASLGWTPELVSASFYALLVIGILSKNIYLKALTIALCMLSRYSIVLFLPVLFLIEWKENGWGRSILLAALSTVFSLFILLPLVRHHWMDLYMGYKHYTISGIAEWRHLDGKGLPWHVLNGNGFAAWMYLIKKGTLEYRFLLMQKIHLTAIIITVILLAAFYFLQKTEMDYRWYTVCGIKIYLAVFYSFIQVPYTYLFLVPVLFSISMLIMMNKNIHPLKYSDI